MKNFKRSTALMLVLATAFAMTGCKPKETKNRKKASEDEEQEERDTNEEKGLRDTNEEKSSPQYVIIDLGDDFPGQIEAKLGIDKAAVTESDPTTFPKYHAYEGKYYILPLSDEPSIECWVYDDLEEAKARFQELCETFETTFKKDTFGGDYQYCSKDDYGYIVVDGKGSGTTIFGDAFAYTLHVYGGYYYSDDTIICVTPKNDVDLERVKEVISLLGLPMADGENT